MDLVSVIGVTIGFAALIGGNFLEGGSIATLLNGPAAIIVFGGTLGAAVLQTPREGIRRALSMFPWIVLPPKCSLSNGIAQVVSWSQTARKEGLLGLENASERENDSFDRKALQLLVDGSDTEVIRHVLETDLAVNEQRDVEAAQFYESMGGYAPTIGIIGAVMGLIHVMQHLADPSELGPGIAVAFVATIYGVAAANLLLLPIASRLRACIKEQSLYRELTIEGICAIADGENPKAIEMKLSGYLR
ncbi:flagellar motor protein [Agaribacterium haliotis]|uniref:flagellar motor protein n=1 Tax=Agaribacterium haliotis TaxID=2013869 RepID=UPI000BB52EEA|nr:flagellar motor protein [Agaribacterium haliotis]